MKRVLPALLATLLTAAVLPARPPVPPPPPAGAAPEVAVVRLDGGNLVREVTVPVYVPVTREVTEVVGGQTVKKAVTSYVLQYRQEQQAMNTDGVRAWTADGKALDGAALARRLARPTVVCISRDGQPLSPSFRSILKEDTIILALPMQPGAVDPPPPPPGLTPPPEVRPPSPGK